MNSTPDRVGALYSLAANGDAKAKEQLIAEYERYIRTTAAELQEKHKTKIDAGDIYIDGIIGLLEALKSFQLISPKDPYAAWIEKKIHGALESRIMAEAQSFGGRRSSNE